MLIGEAKNNTGFFYRGIKKMAQGIRKKHSNRFKFQVALAALKGDKTVAELCQAFGLVSSQIYAWKQQLEKNGADVFSDKRKAENKQEDVDKLHRIIGKLTVERDFLSGVLNRFK